MCLPIYQTFFRFTVLNFRCLSFLPPVKTIVVFLSFLLCNKQKYIAVLFSQLSQRVRRSIFLGANPYYAFVIFVSGISRHPLYFRFPTIFFLIVIYMEFTLSQRSLRQQGCKVFENLTGD